MTIDSCLTLVDSLIPNQIGRAVKCRWLEELDAQLRIELWDEAPSAQVEPTGTTDGSRRLTAPYPYDRLYRSYLAAKIYGVQGDAVRYENSAAQFNAAYLHYAKYVIRTGERGEPNA